MSEPYDSRTDTLDHIDAVRARLFEITEDLRRRAREHDASKLEDPERSTFDEFTPKLAALTYGSPEYKQALQDMGPALAHHYEANDHHPEHFREGVRWMNLMQLTEMLADWKAATERHADGDLRKSIEHNVKRFDIEEPIENLLLNTAEALGWI